MTTIENDDRAPRVAGPELRMGLAELDLRWYFGGAGRTAAGDMGLRSPMGAQLDAARLGAASTRNIDVDASVDRMDEQIEAVRRWRCVRARLEQLTPRRSRILGLACGGARIGGGLSAAVVLTEAARDLWSREVRAMARRWTTGVEKGRAISEACIRERFEATHRTKVHALPSVLLPRRLRPEEDAQELIAAVERWAVDERLLGEHLSRLGRAERALVVEEGEQITADALSAFAAVERCWPRRADVSLNELSARRCERCGHRNVQRAAEERRARRPAVAA
jgi:hypothetical protein